MLPESGSIMVLGQTREDDPLALYQYRLDGGRLQKLRQVKLPCIHVFSPDILGVIVEGQELLAVACIDCGDIKLMNLETRETHVAYRSEMGPDTLCHGQAGRMWLTYRSDVLKVTELDCSSKTFTETGRTVKRIDWCRSLCYLPAPLKSLVLCYDGWMEAVSCETGQQLWWVGGEVEGKLVFFIRVTFLPVHKLLVVMDITHDRVLVLDPGTGTLLQKFGSVRLNLTSWRHQLISLDGGSHVKVFSLTGTDYN